LIDKNLLPKNYEFKRNRKWDTRYFT
jgi:hypothetical protein